MRRSGITQAAVLALFLAVTGGLGAQEAAPRAILSFGPRIGVAAVLQAPGDFTGDMQTLFHDWSRGFFPVFTELGVQVEQMLPLGNTGSSFIFQQTLLVGGLEQRMPLPSFSMALGCRLGLGLELGVGPYATIVPRDPGFTISMAYRVGWTFVIQDLQVPVTLMYVPIPGYLSPRISVLSGVNFGALR